MGKVLVMIKCYIRWQAFFFFEYVIWIIQALLTLTLENLKWTKSTAHIWQVEKRLIFKHYT